VITKSCPRIGPAEPVITKSWPFACREPFTIMKIGPLFPIFGEDFSFHEEFAAGFRDFPLLSLRDHGATVEKAA
jgi:hypothetical protein